LEEKMNSQGFWFSLVFSVIGFFVAVVGHDVADSNVMIFIGMSIMGLAALLLLKWIVSNLENFARFLGALTARFANLMDTFKEAFKQGRGK
jgi:hypothetical protein